MCAVIVQPIDPQPSSQSTPIVPLAQMEDKISYDQLILYASPGRSLRDVSMRASAIDIRAAVDATWAMHTILIYHLMHRARSAEDAALSNYEPMSVETNARKASHASSYSSSTPRRNIPQRKESASHIDA